MPSKAEPAGIVLSASLSIGILLTVIYATQNRLLYFPQQIPLAELQKVARLKGVTLWPSADQYYQGLLHRGPQGETRGTVMVFHGNAGYALHRDYYVGALGALGYRVLLYEYPGYGARPGKPTEESIVEDACAALRQLVTGDPGPLYLFGESLGAAVASAVARECKAAIKGVALITPWDTLADLAQDLYWFLPARWLVRESYDNLSNLRDYLGPVAVLMAEQDEIVPAERTQRLYRALAEPKRLWVFRGSGHNSWPVGPNEAWWRQVSDYLESGGTAAGP